MSCEYESTYHKILRIPIPDSVWQNEIRDGACWLIGSKIRFEMSFECGLDVIETGSVGVRRFGDDDFLRLLEGFGGKGSGESSLSVAVRFWLDKLPSFFEIPIFDNVVAGVGDRCTGFWSGLDVTMFVLEVEVTRVGDTRFLATGELDEGMMMRACQVFLTDFGMTFGMFVVFATDNDITGLEGFNFIPKEFEQFFVIKVGISVRQENVFSLDFERHFCGIEMEEGGLILPPLRRVEGTYTYKNRGIGPKWSVGKQRIVIA